MKGKRKVIAWILAIAMVIGFFNVPIGTANVQAGEGDITITWNAGGPYIIGGWDDTLQDYQLVSTVTDIYDGGLHIPDVSQIEGYQLAGWKIEGDADTLYVLDTPQQENQANIYEYVPTEDTVFEAQWEQLYKLVYDYNGGANGMVWEGDVEVPLKSEELYITAGSTIGYYPKAEKDGYVIIGYRINDNGTLSEELYSYYEDEEKNVKDIFYYVPDGDVEFVAQWAQAYKVSFDYNGGYCGTVWEGDVEVPRKSEEMTIGAGSSVGYCPDAVKDGYVLLGYKINDNGTLSEELYSYCEDEEKNVKDIYSYVPDGDVEFVAQWAQAYKVSFDYNGGYYGTVWDSESESEVPIKSEEKGIAVGSSVNYYPEPVNDDLMLLGYRINNNGTLSEELYSNYEDEEKNVKDIYSYVPDGDVEFVAQWAQAYKVSFDYNGGSYGTIWDGESEVPQKRYEMDIVAGSSVDYYPDAEKDGYILRGYRISDNGTLSEELYSNYEDEENNVKTLSSYVPDGDVEFVAQWESGYKISFQDGDDEISSFVIEKGESLEGYYMPYPEKAGCILTGYKVKDSQDSTLYIINNVFEAESGTEYIVSYVPTEDIVFEAQWLTYPDDLYKYTFDGNGGNIAAYTDENGETKYTDTVVYYVDKSNANIRRTDRTYNSVFLVNDYNSTDSLDGFTVDGDDTVYTTESGGPGGNDNYIWDYSPTGDTVFKAKWGAPLCTVTYEANGGYYEDYINGEKVETDTWSNKIAKGSAINYSSFAPTREGYRVLGYKIKGEDKIYYAYRTPSSPTDVDYIMDYVVEDDVTFETIWQKCYYIVFVTEEGQFDSYNDVPIRTINERFDDGKAIPYYPIPQCDGKVLVGYKIGESDTVLYDDDYLTRLNIGLENPDYPRLKDYMPTADATMYAVWSEDCASIGHNMTAHAAVAETCTEPGNSAYWYCDRCNKYFSDEDGETEIEEDSWVIEASGHVYDQEKAEAQYLKSAATCTSKAVYYKSCTCGEKGTATFKYGNALGHNMTAHAAVAETCTEPGNSAYWYCDRCNKYFSDEDGETEIEEDSWVIEASGHVYDQEKAEAQYLKSAATCTSKAVYYKSCVCGEKGTATFKYGKALGHDWDDGVITTYPTCTETGLKTVTCTRDGCNVTDTVVVDALGHNMTAYAAVAETCTEPGNSAYWYCDQCEKYFSDANGNTEIDEDSWVIEASGHVYDQEKADAQYLKKAATCTSKAVYYKSCTCGKKGTETFEYGEALGHSWNSGTVTRAATCTKKGVMTYTCSTCKKKRTEDIAATGHSWDDGKVTKEPTCTEKGEKTYTCKNCKETKTEDIAAKGHMEAIDPAIPATTASTGLTEGTYCPICGKVIKPQKVVPMLEEEYSIEPAPAEQKPEEPAPADTTPAAEPQREAHGNISDGLYVVNTDGTKVTNEWVNVDGVDYYIDATGYAAAGEYANGVWFDSDGKKNDNYNMSWLSNDTGYWIEDTSGWYPASSWLKIDGYWYYFDASGYMETSAWRDGCWLGENGAWTYPYTGSWKSDNTGWWFEDTLPWYPTSRWLKIDGSWYYFEASGYIATNKYVDGYWLGADGVCQ